MKRARTAAGLALDRVDAWRHRGAPSDADLLRQGPVRTIGADDRISRPFDRDAVLTACGHTATIEDRSYPYVLLPGAGQTLCIHYSAFFGEWGDRRQTRAQFAGWFHRLRMFWPLASHHFLFLCDMYGADRNGTYYKGEAGDFFVERAMEQIQSRVAADLGIDPARTVTLGSSMGATAALRFALRLGYSGAVAVSPHIDLDISALRQGRLRHVAAIVGRDDVDAEDLQPVTREVARLAATVRPLPRLVIQSMLDDAGVHDEQVVPLVELGGPAAARCAPTSIRPAVIPVTTQLAEFFSDAIDFCLGLG